MSRGDGKKKKKSLIVRCKCQIQIIQLRRASVGQVIICLWRRIAIWLSVWVPWHEIDLGNFLLQGTLSYYNSIPLEISAIAERY